MRKFYIQVVKGNTSIIEVEGNVLPISDPFVAFLHEGEYGFEISKPASLKGEKLMWFVLFETELQAMDRVKQDLAHEVERKISKGQLEEEQATEYYNERLALVKVSNL